MSTELMTVDAAKDATIGHVIFFPDHAVVGSVCLSCEPNHVIAVHCFDCDFDIEVDGE